MTTAVSEEKAFCSICNGLCGVRVTLDENKRLVSIRGDRDHPLSRGFTCIKGIAAVEAHNHPDRLLHPLVRSAAGVLERTTVEAALDAAADRLGTIVARHGPLAVAAYRGTTSWYDHLSYHMLNSFMAALGSHQMYTSLTLDQSAKIVTAGRLGSWSAGGQDFDTSDVWMLIGANPLVSVATPGFYSNPVKAIKDARARGLKLIVIDPRRSETALHADIFLQPRPGEDVSLLAGMLRMILAEGWEDKDFCAAYADGLAALKDAVEPFTPSYVEARAGISAAQLREATELFARQSRRGRTATATGPSMAPRSNLSEHLAEAINVVCGRFMRVGDKIPNPGVMSPRRSRRAEVVAPTRPWERGPRSRLRDEGQVMGEFPASSFPDEILTPGEGQIRAVVSVGGNPASAFPDQRKIVTALRSLDWLMTTDPVMSTTARIADFLFAPLLHYERPTTAPMAFGDDRYLKAPLAAYNVALASPPPGSELVHEWYVLWGIAKRLGLQMHLKGGPVDMVDKPTAEDLYTLVLAGSAVPFADVVRRRGEVIDVPPQFVEPAVPGSASRFVLAPDDITAELGQVAAEDIAARDAAFSHRLIARRMREVSNSMYRELDIIQKRRPFNPAFMPPGDIAALGIASGDWVKIRSATGSMIIPVEADSSLLSGVISCSHSWGGLPDDDPSDPATIGSNVNLLLSVNEHLEPINGMPVMSAVPVNIRPLREDERPTC